MIEEDGIAGLRHALDLVQIACATRPTRGLEEAVAALQEAEAKLGAMQAERDQLREEGARRQRPEEAAQDLKARLDRLTEPPLQHALVAGLSPARPETVTISLGGERYDVRSDPGIDLASLQPGQEVLVNRELLTLVGVLGESPRGETAEVVNVLDPETPEETHVKRYRRLQVRHSGGEGLVVECTSRLREQPLAIGDIVRIDSRLMVAFEKLPPYEAGQLQLEEVPDVTYGQIGGLDREIRIIREAIEIPYLHRHLFERYRRRRPKGILLCGPPGCGKTLIAKAIANSLESSVATQLKQINAAISLLLRARANPDDPAWLEEWRERRSSRARCGEEGVAEIEAFLQSRDVPNERLESKREEIQASLRGGVRSYFLNVKGPELLNKYVGETEYRIRKVFDEAKRVASFATPVVIFFDEMDAMFQTRGSGISSDIEKTIVPQFLAEMDGIEAIHDIILIGASNRPELIDPAILRSGRIDRKIPIGRPNRDGASSIFAKYLTPELPLSAVGMTPLPTGGEEVSGRLIEYTLGLLYDNENALRVSTETGAIRDLPLRDFMSGALIESIVGRAKERAMNELIERPEQCDGAIGCSHLRAAIEAEFVESRDQLVRQHPDLPRSREEGRTERIAVQLRMRGRAAPRWFRAKPRPYRGEAGPEEGRP